MPKKGISRKSNSVYLRGKYWCVLMDTECAKSTLRGLNSPDFIFHADVPEFNLSTATATNELSHSTALHVHVRDPLLVCAVHLHHGRNRPFALVKDPHFAVSETGDKNMTCYLIRGQGCDARTRTGRNFLTLSA